jgi:Domain of unknown function (DUF4167)
MRSSKSRSRSKPNRPRTIGNIINRVFDSSGPEGKVRGTPQQIIEKYLFLARDAQLSNDRVAAENFLQHAEHYTRMLGEAQREMAAEQEARQGQQGHYQGSNGQGQGNGNGNGQGNGQNNGQNNGNSQNRQNGDRYERRDDRPDFRQGDTREDRGYGRVTAPEADEQPAMAAFDPRPERFAVTDRDEDTGLVETPEARQPQPPRDQHQNALPSGNSTQRSDRAPRPAQQPRNDRAPRPAEVTPAEAAAAPAKAEQAPRRARAPRKPAADTSGSDDSGGPREAAE